jgi:hypothetical protein
LTLPYCTPTSDTTPTYTLTAAEDVGFAIRVEEVASDGSGPSLPATSAPTAAIGPAAATGGAPGGSGSGGGSAPGGTTTPGAPARPPGSGAPRATTAPARGRAAISGAKASGTGVVAAVSCTGVSQDSCTVALSLSVVETRRGGRTIAVTAARTTRVRVPLGGRSVSLSAGRRETVRIALNAAGKRLLARDGELHAGLTGTQDGHRRYARIVVFKARR